MQGNATFGDLLFASGVLERNCKTYQHVVGPWQDILQIGSLCRLLHVVYIREQLCNYQRGIGGKFSLLFQH